MIASPKFHRLGHFLRLIHIPRSITEATSAAPRLQVSQIKAISYTVSRTLPISDLLLVVDGSLVARQTNGISICDCSDLSPMVHGTFTEAAML